MLLATVLALQQMWFALAVGMGVASIAVLVFHFAPRRPRTAAARTAAPAAGQQRDPFVEGSASEQRKATRRNGNPIPVRLQLPGHAGETHAWVVDRSVGGLGLLVSGEIERGTQLRVLPENAPATTPWVDLEVRGCRPCHDGFEIGCQFVKVPGWGVRMLFG